MVRQRKKSLTEQASDLAASLRGAGKKVSEAVECIAIYRQGRKPDAYSGGILDTVSRASAFVDASLAAGRDLQNVMESMGAADYRALMSAVLRDTERASSLLGDVLLVLKEADDVSVEVAREVSISLSETALLIDFSGDDAARMVRRMNEAREAGARGVAVMREAAREAECGVSEPSETADDGGLPPVAGRDKRGAALYRNAAGDLVSARMILREIREARAEREAREKADKQAFFDDMAAAAEPGSFEYLVYARDASEKPVMEAPAGGRFGRASENTPLLQKMNEQISRWEKEDREKARREKAALKAAAGKRVRVKSAD